MLMYNGKEFVYAPCAPWQRRLEEVNNEGYSKPRIEHFQVGMTGFTLCYLSSRESQHSLLVS